MTSLKMAVRNKQVVKDQFEKLKELTINDIELGEVIGRGASGKILRGNWKGAPCAVKEIHSIFQEIASEIEFAAFRTAFVEECRRSIRLRHPNIVQFFGVCYPPSSGHLPRLVMELLHCSLTGFLENNSEILHKIKLSILHDISLGLRFLHTSSPPIIHRDLSSNNVLISRGYVAKIGDLGTARFLKPHNQAQLSKVSQLTKAPGTVDFMPPEVMFDNPQYGTSLDVFSFACVCLHTITQKWPSPTAPVYTDPKTNMLLPRSEAERRASFLDMFCNEALFLKPLLLDCLKNNPNARPSIVEVSKKLVTLKGSYDQLPLHNLLGDDTDCQLQHDSGKGSNSLVDYWESLEKVWENRADLPKAEHMQNVTRIDSTVYVRGLRNVFCYKFHEDVWSTLPSLPVLEYSLGCIVPTKQLVAIGGVSELGISNKVLLWDKNCWRKDVITSGMTVPRYDATAVGYHSSVIVIGGRIDSEHSTTQSVEVLRINPKDMAASHWCSVQSIPFGTENPMTVIVDDTLYVAGGFMLSGAESYMASTSIPSLLSSKSSTSGVWSDVTHLPCATQSFTSFKNHLLVFGGDYIQCIIGIKRVWKAVPSIYLYHSQMKQWEVVGKVPYFFGRCINLSPSKIMFFGGLADPSINSFLVQCQMLTLTEPSTDTTDSATSQRCILQ